MMTPRNMSSGASRLLLSFFLLFLVGSVSAQYTTASDGDFCFDPEALETSTTKYSNSTASATKSTKSVPTSLPTISATVTTGTTTRPTSTSPAGNSGSTAAPGLLLGLVAALVAV